MEKVRVLSGVGFLVEDGFKDAFVSSNVVEGKGKEHIEVHR